MNDSDPIDRDATAGVMGGNSHERKQIPREQLTAGRASAAIYLVESLLLTLAEKGLISAEDIRGIIDDVRAASANPDSSSGKEEQLAMRIADAIVRQIELATVDEPQG